MSEGIKVRLSFDPSQLLQDEKKIQQWVNKNLKIKIPVELDKGTLKELSQYIKQTSQIAKQVNSIKTPKFDFANPSKEAKFFLDRVNSLVSGFRRFGGEVKYAYDEFGKLNIQLKKADGTIKNYGFNWDSNKNVFKKTNAKVTDNSDAINEKQLIEQQKVRLKLEKELRQNIESNLKAVQSYYNNQQKLSEKSIFTKQKEIEQLKLESASRINKNNNDREKSLQYEQKVRIALEKQLENQVQSNLKTIGNYYNSQQSLINKTINLRQKELEQLTKLAESRISKNSNDREKVLQQEQKIRKEIEKQSQTVKQFKDNYLDVKIPSLQGLYKGHYDQTGVSNLISQIKNLKDNATNFDMKNIEHAFNKIQSNAKITAKDMGQLEHSAMNLGDSIKLAGYKMMIWSVVGDAIFNSIQKVQEAFDFMLEQNKLFTNLQMEMTDTNLSFGQITGQANDFASSMGATTDSVMKAISVFGTYNSTMDEVLKKSQAALIMNSITGSGIEQSSDEIMATLTQFKLGAEDAMHVVDTITSVARNLQVDFPKAVEEISSGMRNVGTVAQTSGTSVEMLSAMLGTLVEKTRRSGSQLSNGLKTIFSRLQNVGDEIDPAEFDGIEKAFYKIGIRIKENEKDIKPLPKILDELAAKWKYLSDVQKQAIAKESAGVYQRNTFLALMENYNDVIKNNESALNSEGVAMQKQEIYMKSLTASLNQLKAEWEEFYLNSINNGFWKLTIDGATGAMDAFNKFAGTVGSIPAILTSATVAASLLSTKLRTGLLMNLGQVFALGKVGGGFGGFQLYIPMFSRLNALATQFKVRLDLAKVSLNEVGQTGVLTALKGAFTSLTAGVNTYTIATKVAKVATIALQGAMTLGLSIALSFLAEKLFTLADETIHAKEKQQELFNELRNSTKETSTQVVESEKLINRYKELSKQTQLTTEQKQELTDIQVKLAETFPETITGINAEGKAIAENTKLVEKSLQAKKDELEQKRKTMSSTYLTQGEDKAYSLDSQKAEFEGLIKKRQELENELQDRKSKGLFYAGTADDLDEVNKRITELIPIISQGKTELFDMTRAFISTSEAGSKLESQTITKLSNALVDLNGTDVTKIQNLFKDSGFISSVEKAKDKINDIFKNSKSKDFISDLNNAYKDGFDGLIDKLETVGIKGAKAKEIIEAVFQAPNISEALQGQLNEGQGFIEQANKAQQLVDTYKKLTAEKSLNKSETQQLTGVSQQLMALFPQQVQNGQVQIGLIESEIDSQKRLGGALVATTQTKISQAISDNQTELARVNNNIANIMREIQALNTLSATRASVFNAKMAVYNAAPNKQIDEGVLKGFEPNKVYNIIAGNDKARNDAKKALQSEVDANKKAQAQIQKGIADLRKIQGSGKAGGGYGGGGGSKKSGGGSGSGGKTGKSAEQVQLEKYISAISSAKQEYNELTKLLERKTNLGIVTGLDIFKTKLQNQEQLVNKLFDIESDLTKKLKDYQAQLGKYKAGTQQYKALQSIISLVKKDISSLPAEQEKQVTVLAKLKQQMTEIEYLTSRRTLQLKIQLGILKGFEAEDSNIDLLKTKLDGLFEQANTLNEQFTHNQEQITANNKIARDALTNRNKFKKGTADYDKWDKINKDAVADNKKLVSLNSTLGTQQQSINATIQDTNTELEKTKKLHEKIKETTDGIESNLQSVIDRIKELNNNSKDTLIDVGINIGLNKKHGTDLFGTSEDFFDNIKSTVMEKVKGIEKLKVDLANATTEGSKQLYEILHNPTSSEADKNAILDLIDKKNTDVKDALSKAGLTEEDLIKYTDGSLQAVVDLINKQNKEIKDAQSVVDTYELELKALEDKVDAQEQLNQLKEKELKITEIQAEIDKVKADKRFEFINEDGIRTLTYDIEKVNDLEKQKIDAQNDLKEFKYQQDVDNQKKAIQDKIDAQQKYIDEELPKLHAQEMAQFSQSWMVKELGTKQNEDVLTSLVKTGVLDRINLYEQEIKKLQELMSLQQGKSMPNLFEVQELERSILASPNSKSITDAVKAGQLTATKSTVNNTTVVNIGNMRFEGKYADAMYQVLKDMGVTVAANA